VSKTLYKPENLRMNGSCPLTPDEMGLLLSGLGFLNSTPVYIASKVTMTNPPSLVSLHIPSDLALAPEPALINHLVSCGCRTCTEGRPA
jgi:hypothetical protein